MQHSEATLDPVKQNQNSNTIKPTVASSFTMSTTQGGLVSHKGQISCLRNLLINQSHDSDWITVFQRVTARVQNKHWNGH